MTDFTARRAAFRKLHEAGCFVMPNPWDIGTARYLRSFGFKALATTSSGFSFSRGLPDTDWAVPLEDALAHIAEIVSATELPVNADFESGYAHDVNGVATNVARCVTTGVAGLSIEDSTGDPAKPLYDLDHAVERIAAARAAIDASGSDVVLTARAECYLVGHADPLNESVKRLQAYAQAGADVLYAPGPRKRADITTILEAVAPKPFNLITSSNSGLTVEDIAGLGVRRISVGSALARAAWTGFLKAALLIAKEGRFAGFDGTVGFGDLNAFFRQDSKDRSG